VNLRSTTLSGQPATARVDSERLLEVLRGVRALLAAYLDGDAVDLTDLLPWIDSEIAAADRPKTPPPGSARWAR
jgi:hypothetical protein